MKSQKPPRGTLLNKSHPLARGLVGCWLMNEGTGERIFDYSGNGNHGLMTNMDPTTDWKAGPHGWAVDFDGNDDYISIGAKPIFDANRAYSWHLLFSVASVGAIYRLMQKCVDGVSGYQIWLMNTGAIVIQNAHTNETASSVPVCVASNIVYHVIVVYDDVVGIYINGIDETADSTIGIMVPDYTSDHKITATQNTFLGCVQSAAIYDRALSPAEIAWLYREPYAMFENTSRSFKEVKKIYSRGGATR